MIKPVIYKKTETDRYGTTRDIYYYRYHDVNGKFVRRQCKGCNTPEEAFDFVQKFLERKYNQYYIRTIAQTMFIPGSAHMNRFTAFGKKLDISTIEQKRYYIERIIELFGDRLITEISVRDIESFLLADNHSIRWKNYFLETFGAIFDETEWVCDKPVRRPPFRRFQGKSKKADVLSRDEMIRLLNPDNFDDFGHFLIFLLISVTGLRLGEARGIRVNQIVEKTSSLLVNGYISKAGVRTTYNKKGSESDLKIRIVPLPEKIVKTLILYAAMQKKGNGDFIFTYPDGSPWKTDHCEWHFKKALRKAEISTENRKIVPHSLRFTYITRLRSQLPVEIVKRLAGHASLQMTDYYTRFNPQDLLQEISPAFEAVNSLLEP